MDDKAHWLTLERLLFRGLSKRNRFLAFLGSALGLAAVVSLIVYTVIALGTTGRPLRIAVIGPMTGSEQRIGQSMRDGAEIYAAEIAKQGGIAGRKIEIRTFDDLNDPAKAAEAAAEAARDPDVVGVVGHYAGAALTGAAPVYREAHLPVLALGADVEGLGTDDPVFRMAPDEDREVQFLANYVRNVLGEKLVSVVYADGAHNAALTDSFDKVMQRFGTKLLFRFPFSADPAAMDGDLNKIVATMDQEKLIGTVVVLGDASASAHAVAALRSQGITNRIVGLRTLATDAFADNLAAIWKGKNSVGSALNGTFMSTPMLFDTAGERAQNFRNSFIEKSDFPPDWIAAYAYDAVHLVGQQLSQLPAAKSASGSDMRAALRDRLSGIDRMENAVTGLNGPIWFDPKSGPSAPILVGLFDGPDLVAALTQLWPIRSEGVVDYLAELTAGRALYVNDRFMYRTSVVYSGVRMNAVTNLDLETRTADLDFMVWFRWRGTLDPQDVVFSNAVTPIKLDTPERTSDDGEQHYRAYRVKGKFFLNFSDVARSYGTELVGIAFRHRELSRDNLMYVSDFLGMGLNSATTLGALIHKSEMRVSNAGKTSSSLAWLEQTLSQIVDIDPLVQLLNKSHVLAGVGGWVIDHAWLSQDLSKSGIDGDPTFVGFGKSRPEFSLLTLGVILKPDVINLRDLFPQHVFMVMAIFALFLALLASLLDRRDRGQFWRMQTLGLRLVAWPTLLLAVGSLALGYALKNFSTGAVDSLMMIDRMLWWLVPARLVAISVERFIWVPLENRTGRKIPNVIRIFVATTIYLFAIFGVIAFVMGKTITSLLATSGLMAMIIGLAVQSNLKDVFSGIVLNIERPFSINDLIKINQLLGTVVDITWRTTRILSQDGQMVSLPNGKMSEAEIHNYTRSDGIRAKLKIFLDPRHDPKLVQRLVLDSATGIKDLVIANKKQEPKVFFNGVEPTDNGWAASYMLQCYVREPGRVKYVLNDLWRKLWQHFRETDITWDNATEILGEPGAHPDPGPVIGKQPDFLSL